MNGRHGQAVSIHIDRLVVDVASLGAGDLTRLRADVEAEVQRRFSAPQRPARCRHRGGGRTDTPEAGSPLARAIADSVRNAVTVIP